MKWSDLPLPLCLAPLLSVDCISVSPSLLGEEATTRQGNSPLASDQGEKGPLPAAPLHGSRAGLCAAHPPGHMPALHHQLNH